MACLHLSRISGRCRQGLAEKAVAPRLSRHRAGAGRHLANRLRRRHEPLRQVQSVRLQPPTECTQRQAPPFEMPSLAVSLHNFG
jgi:hypothetical protein